MALVKEYFISEVVAPLKTEDILESFLVLVNEEAKAQDIYSRLNAQEI